MTIRPLNVGAAANDGTGMSLRQGGILINENFAELDETTVKKSGDQVVDGVKDFSKSPLVPNLAVGTNTQQAANMAALLAGMAAFGVGGTVSIPDANTLVGGGLYSLNAGGTGGPALLGNIGWHIIHIPGGVNAGSQIATPATSVSTNRHRIFHRQRWGGVWGEWREFADTDSPTLIGAPTSTTPVATDSSTRIQTTAGSLAQMQQYGLGGALAPAIANLDAQAEGGMFRIGTSAIGHPLPGAAATIVHIPETTNGRQTQLAITTHATNTVLRNRFFWRSAYAAGQWDGWQEGASLAGALAQMQQYGIGGTPPTVSDLNSLGGGPTMAFRAVAAATNNPGNGTNDGGTGMYFAYSAVAGLMFFQAAGTNRMFTRAYLASTWGPWDTKVGVNNPAFTGTLSIGNASNFPGVHLQVGSGRGAGLATLNGTTQRTINLENNFNSTATSTGTGFRESSSFGNNVDVFTCSQHLPFVVEAAICTTGATVGNQSCFIAVNQNDVNINASKVFDGRNNVLSGKERWNAYMVGTAPNYFRGDVRIGTLIQDGTSLLTVAGAGSFSGPVKPGSYTVATLPPASGFSGYLTVVTNASNAPAGPKVCYSNGTNWTLINTTTQVA